MISRRDFNKFLSVLPVGAGGLLFDKNNDELNCTIVEDDGFYGRAKDPNNYFKVWHKNKISRLTYNDCVYDHIDHNVLFTQQYYTTLYQTKWYKDGKLHRENSPAIEQNNWKQWYINGQLHRIGGPALEMYDNDNTPFLKRWCINDVMIKSYERVRIRKENIITSDDIHIIWYNNEKPYRVEINGKSVPVLKWQSDYYLTNKFGRYIKLKPEYT